MEDVLKILQQYWGYKTLREGQSEVINEIISGRDVLALMPTGGGKSLCYQLPAIYLKGITVVISPLISLMNDQVESLNEKGIRAIALHSGHSPKHLQLYWQNALQGAYQLIYMSPEKATSEKTIGYLKNLDISFFAIDEAHCISQWGHDFRPSYLGLEILKRSFGETAFMALTATANDRVVNDINTYLGLRNTAVIKRSFRRDNLQISFEYHDQKLQALQQLIQGTQEGIIVYTRSRRSTVELALFLNRRGIPSLAYHAGMEPEQKQKNQVSWTAGKVSVIVATTAFGMGIDKSNVRLVVHWDLPMTIEEYYQEIGRAGRDGKRSRAVLLYNDADLQRPLEWLEESWLERGDMEELYLKLINYLEVPAGELDQTVFGFNLAQFADLAGQKQRVVFTFLRTLEKYEILRLSEGLSSSSTLMILAEKQDLFNFLEHNPQYELIIKTLLRIYEGLFSISVKIDEEKLARLLDIETDEVHKKLTNLDRRKIVGYRPRSSEPAIVFPGYRYRLNDLPVDWKSLVMHQNLKLSRLKSVIDLVQSGECAMQQILNYFGEKNEKSCGQCSSCEKKSPELLTTKF